jgi:hypothetical protein
LKTLILGGYGNFGARIARALTRHDGMQLLIGGRDAARAGALAASLGAHAQALAIDLHDEARLVDTLRSHGVELLIHTAGPFQAQGYGVARAAARAGAHYIDLADGRRFVCDFAAALNDAFRAASRCAITGASTVPALSSAVVEHLTQGWRAIEAIDVCIAPAQNATRGAATMAAVLGYCGESLEVWLDGRWQRRRGWAHPERVRFARLAPRLGALCDIPDLELFPRRYAGVRSVMFRAALEVPLAQRGLALLAALRGARCAPPLAPWARALNGLAAVFDPFGSAVGGMVVRVSGVAASGQPVVRAWHVTAPDNNGPEIPCMAAILLAERIARGQTAAAGAHACMGLLRLADFEPEFARWRMATDVVDEQSHTGVDVSHADLTRR